MNEQPMAVAQPRPGEMTVADVRANVQLVKQVLHEVMTPGHHYGKIPGTSGTVLLKAGAEKLAMVFRLAPKFEIQTKDLPNGHREYSVTCLMTHIPTGTFLGAGVGAASTLESKYRYRWQGEGKNRSKKENPDIADVYNTVLKIAKKRAQIDATLTVTGASDIFAPEPEDGDDEQSLQERAQLVQECAELYKQFGGDAARIDKIHAAAGIAKGKAPQDLTDDEWRRIKVALTAALPQAGFASSLLLVLVALLFAFAAAAQVPPRIPAKVEVRPAPVEASSTPAPLPQPDLAAILVDNLGARAQSSWVVVGLPPNTKPVPACGTLKDADSGAAYTYLAGDRCVRVHLVDVAPGRHKLMWTGAESKLEFSLAPGLDLMRTIPRWWYDGQLSDPPALWLPGTARPGDAWIAIEEADAAHVLFHVREQHRPQRLTHDLWATVWSGQKQIDFVTISTYGDTRNDKQPMEIALGALFLRTGVEQWADFRTQVSLPQSTVDGDGWLLLTNTPGDRLMRARRILTRGTWLPDGARKGPPLSALYAGWDANWFGGHTATPPKNALQDLAECRAAYLMPARGSYWDARSYTQPKWAETTGEQAGFGINLLGRAVALGEPWFVHSMLFNCDSYAYRPTANRDPSGEPFTAASHPLATPFGQAFEQRFSESDLCGWPRIGEEGVVQTQWIGPTVSEQQHRDARSLHATIALTRDPALISVVRDCLELEQNDIMRKQHRVGAERALGRMLLDFTGAAWLGFDGYRPLIVEVLNSCEQEIARHPGGVFMMGELGEAKRGWNEPPATPNEQPRPVIGWQPWQRTIAATQGMWSAWRITGDRRAYEWAMRGAREVTDLAFFNVGGRWLHVYAFAWRDGSRPPPAAFTGSDNEWMRLDPAADYWDLASCELVLLEEPSSALGAKAREILKAYGDPRSWVEAQWRGVR